MQILAVDLGEKLFGTSHFLTEMGGLGKLVSILLANAIIIAGLVFIVMVVIGGFQFLSGAGSGDPQQVAKGRQIILAAVIGFIIVFASYWLVLIVGESTGTNLLK